MMICLHRLGEPVVSGSALERGRVTNERDEAPHAMGAARVLTGNMAVFGDTMSVTALLIDASSGKVLWGDSLHRNISEGNILAVRDEVATCLARALQSFMRQRVKMAVGDRLSTASGSASNLPADSDEAAP
jgi:hypothetical protein